MTLTCRGVLDRIVDDRTAVILLEEQQRQLNLPLLHLPAGAKEGDRLLVDLSEADGSAGRITLDHEATKASRVTASKARKRLLKTKERSRFKRKQTRS
ncbi:DUF3006 domain-containing protein [Bacillus daqingensis]|uniref:DUF3006 domain-containing protein n=1 Tax=Bacillus daqingensis TaxID=872396 RepID=A0ABV9P0B5_9BACI